MLKVTQKTRYGFRAMIYLAQEKETVSVKQIAESEQIPYSFLEKIIQQLKQAGLLVSQRGVNGGFLLAKPSHEISLGDIINTLEDKSLKLECLTANKENCSRQDHCLAKKGWKKLEQSLLTTMNQITLDNLIN